MLFLLATPEYNNVQANATKVKVHLRNGIAEIYDQHQDLMGKVENNIVELETNFENKIEKFLFVLQDAVFIVSHKGLDGNDNNNETCVYIYAKRVREINSSLSLDELNSQIEQVQAKLNLELEKNNSKENESIEKLINSKVLLIQEDLDFLTKSLSIAKEAKS